MWLIEPNAHIGLGGMFQRTSNNPGKAFGVEPISGVFCLGNGFCGPRSRAHWLLCRLWRPDRNLLGLRPRCARRSDFKLQQELVKVMDFGCKAMACGRRLLNHRSILLCSLIHVVHRRTDLLQAKGLFARRINNGIHMPADLLYFGDNGRKRLSLSLIHI